MKAKACPECGGTEFRVVYLGLTRAYYYSDTGGLSNCSSLPGIYVRGLECAGCGSSIEPSALGLPAVSDLLGKLIRVVVVCPWPDECGVLVGVGDELRLVYRSPSDAGPYAERAEAVAEALREALGAAQHTITFEEFALATGGDISSWEDVPAVVARMMSDASEGSEG